MPESPWKLFRPANQTACPAWSFSPTKTTVTLSPSALQPTRVYPEWPCLACGVLSREVCRCLSLGLCLTSPYLSQGNMVKTISHRKMLGHLPGRSAQYQANGTFSPAPPHPLERSEDAVNNLGEWNIVIQRDPLGGTMEEKPYACCFSPGACPLLLYMESSGLSITQNWAFKFMK